MENANLISIWLLYGTMFGVIFTLGGRLFRSVSITRTGMILVSVTLISVYLIQIYKFFWLWPGTLFLTAGAAPLITAVVVYFSIPDSGFAKVTRGYLLLCGGIGTFVSLIQLIVTT